MADVPPQQHSPQPVGAEDGTPPGAPVPEVLDYSSPERTSRWHVGTLGYSMAGIAVLFFWLLWGDFAYAIRDRSVAQVTQLLFSRFYASSFTYGFLTLALPQAITVLIYPVISYKSDRHRGRWGRRVPFLAIPLPFAVGALVAIAFAPRMGYAVGHTDHAKHWWTVFYLGTFWSIFEVSALSFNCVFTAFVADVVPHRLIGRFYGAFRAISLVAGILFNEFVYRHAHEHYVPIFLAVALVYGLGISSMLLMVKEGQYPPPPPPDPGEPSGSVERVLHITLRYLRDSFTQPYFIVVFAASAIGNVGISLINGFNVKFSESMHIDTADYGHWQAIMYTCSLLQALPVGWAVDKFHTARVAIVGLLLHAAFAIFGGMFIHDRNTFAVAFIGVGIFSGTFFTATAGLPAKLLPRDRLAQFNAALMIVQSIVGLVASMLAGLILDWAGNPYRHTYTAAFALDISGAVLFVVVWRMYRTRKAEGLA